MKPILVTERGTRVPRTLTEATRTITHLGMTLIKIRSIKRDYDRRLSKLSSRIAKLEKEKEHLITPLDHEAKGYASALLRYAAPRRSELTHDGEKKTVTLSNRSYFRWFMPGRARIVVDEEHFYEEAEEKGLTEKFVRITKEPNKQAMQDNLDDALSLTSVTTEKKERFIICPHNVEQRAEIILDEPHPEWKFEDLEK